MLPVHFNTFFNFFIHQILSSSNLISQVRNDSLDLDFLLIFQQKELQHELLDSLSDASSECTITMQDRGAKSSNKVSCRRLGGRVTSPTHSHQSCSSRCSCASSSSCQARARENTSVVHHHHICLPSTQIHNWSCTQLCRSSTSPSGTKHDIDQSCSSPTDYCNHSTCVQSPQTHRCKLYVSRIPQCSSSNSPGFIEAEDSGLDDNCGSAENMAEHKSALATR